MTENKTKEIPVGSAPQEAKTEEKIKFKNLNKGQKHQIYTMFGSFVIVFTIVLVTFCSILFMENYNSNHRWYSHLQDPPNQASLAAEKAENAQEVVVGTYVENIRNFDIKASSYRVDMMAWFEWDGDPNLDPANNFRIYKGTINKLVVMDEYFEGGKNYQLVGIDVTISRNFHTKLFPLESHQLRIFLEANEAIQDMVFRADRDNSGINESLEVTGFDFKRWGIGEVSHVYDSTHGNPRLDEAITTSEVVTALEITRSGLGLYFKCFIALFATLIWILISLYICTYHHVNPLGMISGALFGAVGNIVVGANLMPDGTSAGLLEFGNIWGTIMVLAGTIAIISINRVRELRDNKYSKYYGTLLFNTILVYTIAGMVLLPLFAFFGG